MLPDPGRAVTLTVQQETRAPGESDSSERAKFETEIEESRCSCE